MSCKGLLYLVDTNDDLCVSVLSNHQFLLLHIYVHHFQDLSHPDNQIEKNQMLFLGL